MQIEVNDNQRISEIQENFSRAFPFLKIVFYNMSKERAEGQEAVSSQNIVGRIGKYRKSGTGKTCLICSENTVSELKKLFSDLYDLKVQVFRKSGKAWLETNATAYWSLDKQNSQGEQLSSSYNL